MYDDEYTCVWINAMLDRQIDVACRLITRRFFPIGAMKPIGVQHCASVGFLISTNRRNDRELTTIRV